MSSSPEPRESSAFTAQLLLAYLERAGGRAAVEATLRRCGLEHREAELRDESHWFSFARKVALFESAVEVLGDPLAIRRMGASALELGVGNGLKLALRALGSPRIVYQNIVRANAKFSASHTMSLLELRRDGARVAYAPTGDAGFHPLDCDYNVGLLSCVPGLFGLPPARVSHPVCMADGAERCVYEVRWTPRRRGLRARRARRRELEATVREQAEVAERLVASLQDLVSELRLEEVLGKITRNAQAAVGGKEFALLLVEGGTLRCQSASGLPPESAATLEAWASRTSRLMDGAMLLDDVATVAELAPLPRHPMVPLGSLCAAPVIARGEPLGVLVALATRPRTFLPRDVQLVQSYATQAAIAIANARLYEAQAALATRDPLTGLLNHREFHDAIGQELERSRRYGDAFAVVLFDLDGFKLVNDLAGHAEGDRVLRGVAAALIASCRAADVAFRVGGDEFALLLPGTSGADAIAVAERAREAIAAQDPRTTAAYGIGGWPEDGWSKDVLLAHADDALYAMKPQARRQAGASARRDGASPPLDEHDRLAVAGRLSARLASAIEPRDVAQITVEELELGFGYELASILRLDDDGTLQMAAGAGPLARGLLLGGWSQGAGEGVCGRVVSQRRPALVQDARLDPDHLAPNRSDPDGAAELRAQLAVPVLVQDRLWGVLSLEASAPGAFGADDLLLLETIAAQVGGALLRTGTLGELGAALAATIGMLARLGR